MLPYAWILLAALVLPFLPLTLRRTLCVLAPALSFYTVATLSTQSGVNVSFLGYDLTLLRVDALSRIFGLVFAGAATAANLYGWHRTRIAEQAAALIYAGGGMAVVFAGDLFTMLVAWEVMAVSSALLVFLGGTPGATAAAQRYLLVHLVAGGLLLLGIGGHVAANGGLAFDAIPLNGWPGWALLAALCLNAAVPPVHGWLPDAYPRASIASSVFLSTFTTKAAVYCLVRGFAGAEILIAIGAVMALYGVIFATMEDDMRRLLSYHIVSQVGYMVCGVGVGTELALNGTVAHAVCHILYKALLFMAVGAVIYRTGKQSLAELGGLYKKMPLTLGLYLVGALSISGAPLFNGFVSKSLVVSGAAEAHHTLPVFLLTLASVGTFLSVGLKLPYFAWGNAKPAEQSVQSEGPTDLTEAPPQMLAAMGVLALACVGIGIVPSVLYSLLPWPPVDYHPYSSYHVFEMLLVMFLCAVAFWQTRHQLAPHLGITRDLDQLYRIPAAWLAGGLSPRLDRSADILARQIDGFRTSVLGWVRDPLTRGGADKPAFEENRHRPPVSDVLVGILSILVILALSLFVFS